MTAEVVIASSPESVVASPYVGRKKGNIVIMKMPKPKPVVRCTKLAPMLRRNIAMTRLLMFSDLDLNDIRPTCGWILALEVMLDGIGEDISLTLAVFLRVLLRSEYDGL